MIRWALRIVFLAVMACFAGAAFWYFTAATPARPDMQMQFAKDTAIFEFHRLTKPRDAKTWDYYLELSHDGNLPARLKIAELLFKKAEAKPVIYKEAVIYLTDLADTKGLPAAQNALGVVYQHGLGVKVDKLEAYKWFAVASKRNHTRARKNMLALTRKFTDKDVAQGQKRADKWMQGYLQRPHIN